MKEQMIKTFFTILIVSLLMSVAPVSTQAADNPDALALAAWDVNPSIGASEEKIQAARQKILQASAWTDPLISVEYSNVPVDSFRLGEHAMSGVQFKLQQTFPFPGKTDKREKMAASMTDVARYELAEKKNQIRGMVKRAYWNLTLFRHLKKITNRHILEIESLIASVTSRYEVGGAGQHDILRLTVLRDRLVDDLSEFDRKDIELVAAINSLLSRSPVTKIETPETVEAAKVALSKDSIFASAQKSRPLLFVWTEQAKAEQLAAKRASHEGFPDPTIWAGYRLREEFVNDQGMVMDKGADFFSVGVSFPIPISYGSRWGALKKESLAKKRSAESNHTALVYEIQGELEKAFAGWNRAFEKSKTYSRIILPGQKQTLDATLAAYQVGRADFASLFAAQVGLLDVERALVKAKCETKLQEAKVETLVGGDIPVQGEDK